MTNPAYAKPSTRQLEALAFIKSYRAAHGQSPTLTEIGTAMGITSRSGINRFICGLERHGLVTRSRKERSIVPFDDNSRKDAF